MRFAKLYLLIASLGALVFATSSCQSAKPSALLPPTQATAPALTRTSAAHAVSTDAKPAQVLQPGSDNKVMHMQFRVGDTVRVRDVQPRGHTRCPRYVRGHRGVVVRIDRPFTLPDLAAHTDRDHREPTYGVRFSATELWSASAATRDAVYVDLWESYLEATR